MITAVIGAGPAGILAALAARASGSEVILIDEHRELGGHLRYHQYASSASGVLAGAWLSELTQALAVSAVTARTETVVWAAYRTVTGFDLMLSSHGNPETLPVDRVILATGTTDIELSVPGATVPGVMTDRAARILIETYGVIPGGRFAIVTRDQSCATSISARLVGEASQVTIIDPINIAEIGTPEGVAFVQTVNSGRIDVDVVVLAMGERPDLQLAGMLDVPRHYDAALNGWYADPDAIPDGITIVGGALLGASTPADLIASASPGQLPQLSLPISGELASGARSTT